MSTHPKPYLTPQQYLEIERAAEYKSEYFNGEMFAMPGGSLSHSMIAGDVFASLHAQLRGRRCKIAGSDLRLQVTPEGLYTYPDIVIFCGKPQFTDEKTDMLTDATVIVEVLSPSTQDYDRGLKFEQYRRLKSLQDYIVIAQDRVHLEHNTRQGDAWLLRETSDLNAVIELPSIECKLRLADAYARVDFVTGVPSREEFLDG